MKSEFRLRSSFSRLVLAFLLSAALGWSGDQPTQGTADLFAAARRSEQQGDLLFSMLALGQQSYKFDVAIPQTLEKRLLKAAAFRGDSDHDATLSDRKVSIVKKQS